MILFRNKKIFGGKEKRGNNPSPISGEINYSCGHSCAHESDVHDCKICRDKVAFLCVPMCDRCVSEGRDTCGCHLPLKIDTKEK
jgi:hypothetical protein